MKAKISIPIDWSFQMIRDEMNRKDNSLIPNDSYSARDSVRRYFEKLFHLLQYKYHPLPKISKQAVKGAVWFFMISAAFAEQPCEPVDWSMTVIMIFIKSFSIKYNHI